VVNGTERTCLYFRLGRQTFERRAEIVGESRGDPFADPPEQTDHVKSEFEKQKQKKKNDPVDKTITNEK